MWSKKVAQKGHPKVLQRVWLASPQPECPETVKLFIYDPFFVQF